MVPLANTPLGFQTFPRVAQARLESCQSPAGSVLRYALLAESGHEGSSPSPFSTPSVATRLSEFRFGHPSAFTRKQNLEGLRTNVQAQPRGEVSRP